MSFENFYEESDRQNRRWRKCVGAAFLLFIAYWAIGLSIAPEPEPFEPTVRSEEPPPVKFADVETTNPESLRRVDELCTNLPKPERFYFSQRTVLVESRELTIVQYTFKSNRDWDDIMPVFRISMDNAGWNALPNNKTTFVKDNQTVAVSMGANSAFEIYCSEKPVEQEAISFGIDYL